MAKIRAVFTDIDNTLTSPITHEIPQSAVRALELARKNGILVVTATGRNLIGNLIWNILGRFSFIELTWRRKR